jgi:hypothetical protein
MVASPAPAAAPPASPAAASKDPHDQEQQYRADGGVDDCTDQSRTEMNTQLRQQPTSDEGAQNPEQEITEYPKTSPSHDLACQPASNETHKQYDQQAFARNIHCAASALWVQLICCRLFNLIVLQRFAFRKDGGQSIRRHLFDQRPDMLRQSVRFACERGTQQPIGYFLADGGAANAVDLNIILNGWAGHERLPACLAAVGTDKSRLKRGVAPAQA